MSSLKPLVILVESDLIGSESDTDLDVANVESCCGTRSSTYPSNLSRLERVVVSEDLDSTCELDLDNMASSDLTSNEADADGASSGKGNRRRSGGSLSISIDVDDPTWRDGLARSDDRYLCYQINCLRCRWARIHVNPLC